MLEKESVFHAWICMFLIHACFSCGCWTRCHWGIRASQSHNGPAVPPLSDWSRGLGGIHLFWYGDPDQRVHRPLRSCTLALGTPKLTHIVPVFSAALCQWSSCLPPPSQQAMVLCHFLETNQDKHNLMDKNVIELGAGTGLVTIVSSLLGMETTVQWWTLVVWHFWLHLSVFCFRSFCLYSL